MKFICKGHKNLLGKHRNSFEFTKDKDLTLQGDCIIGVNANFKIKEIKELLKQEKIKIIIKTDNHEDTIIADINKDFNDSNEIVIRKTNFISNRTLGINANKAAKDLKKELIEELKDADKTLQVIIE